MQAERGNRDITQGRHRLGRVTDMYFYTELKSKGGRAPGGSQPEHRRNRCRSGRSGYLQVSSELADCNKGYFLDFFAALLIFSMAFIARLRISLSDSFVISVSTGIAVCASDPISPNSSIADRRSDILFAF